MTRVTGTAYSTGVRHRAGGVAAYAIALAILMLLAGAALHQDQHTLADLGDTCSICLQIEQFDNTLADAPSGIETIPAGGPAWSAAGDEAAETPGPAYYPRAPPVTV